MPGSRTTICTLAASSTCLPAGLPHAFRIRGDQPARFLAIVEPGGLLHLYDEVGIPATELRLPGPDGQTLEAEIPKWLEVSPQYGLEVVGPPDPRVTPGASHRHAHCRRSASVLGAWRGDWGCPGKRR